MLQRSIPVRLRHRRKRRNGRAVKWVKRVNELNGEGQNLRQRPKEAKTQGWMAAKERREHKGSPTGTKRHELHELTRIFYRRQQREQRGAIKKIPNSKFQAPEKSQTSNSKLHIAAKGHRGQKGKAGFYRR
jgi:hypothetical protein